MSYYVLQRIKRFVFTIFIASGVVIAGILILRSVTLPPGKVTFSQSAQSLEAYDFLEIATQVSWPHAPNCFTDTSLKADFSTADRSKHWQVEGFCDSDDGSIFRIRFMPPAADDYTYSLEYHQGWSHRTSSGSFHVTDGHRRGPIRIDAQNRWHFVWEGTGEHYFFNGTTAYWLVGWRDENVIRTAIDRLHNLKINRMRVTIAGRTDIFFGEPVMAAKNWTPYITPWRTGTLHPLHYFGLLGQKLHLSWGGLFDFLTNSGNPEDLYHPGFDYSRFDLNYWQKFDHALAFARDRDMVISLVLDMNGSRTHPAPGSEDEYRFIRYAIARFGAFSNITWDLGDDLDHYRDDAWTHNTGTLIKQWDPYKHLATSHPIDNVHQDRTSDWFDFTSFQEWSRNQHTFMLAQRKQQASTGRIIPQTNEEYGYEDHYPAWAIGGAGSDSADALRRTAWEIVMAGGYQTSGETARRGTNILPDTGGGWMNGRGDDTMTMFQGYSHMVDFFTSFAWWRAEPHDELVNNGNYCLANPGEIYVAYLPHGGQVTVSLQPGRYSAMWWNAVTGEKNSLPPIDAVGSWTSPSAPVTNDWALLLQKM
jgi:hypothetical protein